MSQLRSYSIRVLYRESLSTALEVTQEPCYWRGDVLADSARDAHLRALEQVAQEGAASNPPHPREVVGISVVRTFSVPRGLSFVDRDGLRAPPTEWMKP